MEQIKIPEEIGVLPLRNSVLFPHAIMPISVGRRKTLSLLDEVVRNNELIAVVSQRNQADDDPDPSGMYRVGTLAKILKVVKLSGNNVNLIIQGLRRIRVDRFNNMEPFVRAGVSPLGEMVPAGGEDVEVEALSRSMVNQFQTLLQTSTQISADLGEMVLSAGTGDPERLSDLASSVLSISVEEKIGLLERHNLKDRIQKLVKIITREVELQEISTKIQSQVADEVGKTQRQYYLREQMKAIQKELGEGDDKTAELEEIQKKIDECGMPEEARKAAEKEMDRLSKMPPQAAEYTVARTYLDWLVTIPWSNQTEDNLDVIHAKKVLDDEHFDLVKVKDRILEYLAVRALKKDLKGPILCLAGPPGVGKTSLGKSIANAMGRKFVRASLGGVRDEAEIRGHRRTYIGSLPGRIIQGMKRAGTRNPVFILDEIDKLGNDFRGDPSSALLEVLDPEQNNSFSDHYLEVPYDLSQVFFLCTANMLDTVPPALRDRMEVMTIPGYTEEEKLEIARSFLVSKQMEAHGLTDENIEFSVEGLRTVINDYTREAGVRNMDREIANVCRKVARRIVEGAEGKTLVDTEKVRDLLGSVKYFREVAEWTDRSGIATGLAWTQVGGEILFVECTKMKGKGKLIITGRLGDVMKESAMAAVSWIKANAESLGLDEDMFEVTDFHIHMPAGAVPKDGPSAGVTLTSALVSLLVDLPVSSDLAMTGEITLRGKVMPVGGIKEKIIAAKSAGIKRVILPEKNVKDLDDVSDSVRDALEFFPVREIDEVLDLAFGTALREKAAAAAAAKDAKSA
ncbi:MAG: endopeptidase La [Acidobacteria bacterium]|uniref:Lon protease n=1 Tax=Candidatus Polarisedimenticola svalbardensis TaxID=2886004 RepID=A0A8J6Y1I7_9BACT|nr:endopeptidase La [Candidatus Polarisedimenticola svalbardensis]